MSKWSLEDLQRVLFVIVTEFEAGIKEDGCGDNELVRNRILDIGKGTLIDNDWWPEGESLAGFAESHVARWKTLHAEN